MMKYYPSLVESVIEFKTYSRLLIAKNKGETYVPEEAHEKISHS